MVYQSVVDPGWWQPKGSPEYGLAATPVGESLPQVREKRRDQQRSSPVATLGSGGQDSM
jgi:hypothetical protein